MKKTLLILLLAFFSCNFIAQATNPFTPASGAIPNDTVGHPYSKVFTFTLPDSVTVDPAVLGLSGLPVTIPPFRARVDTVRFSVTGLPTGLTATYSNGTGIYLHGATGSITISGTTAAGAVGNYTDSIKSLTSGRGVAVAPAYPPFYAGGNINVTFPGPLTLPSPLPSQNLPRAPRLLDGGPYTLAVVNATGVTVTANFTPSSNHCANQTITFTNQSTNATSYAWTFAGGTPTTSTIQNPQVSFATAGAHNVTLIATGSSGSNTHSSTITINPLPPVPTITKVVVTLTSNAATGNQWYKGGTIITGATAQSYTVTANGSYTVVVTDANGCTATSLANVVNNVGINESLLEKEVNIFPNPSFGSFTLEIILTTAQNLAVSIQNNLGQIVYNETYSKLSGKQNISFNLEKQVAGVYFVKLQTNEGIITKKIMIK